MSKNDKNYFINIINSFTYTLTNTQRISSNQKATKTSKHNVVMEQKKTKQQKTRFWP